jgi:hypothetical protein
MTRTGESDSASRWCVARSFRSRWKKLPQTLGDAFRDRVKERAHGESEPKRNLLSADQKEFATQQIRPWHRSCRSEGSHASRCQFVSESQGPGGIFFHLVRPERVDSGRADRIDRGTGGCDAFLIRGAECAADRGRGGQAVGHGPAEHPPEAEARRRGRGGSGRVSGW